MPSNSKLAIDVVAHLATQDCPGVPSLYSPQQVRNAVDHVLGEISKTIASEVMLEADECPNPDVCGCKSTLGKAK